MRKPHPLLQISNKDSHDPTEGASQVAYREISGDIPSTGERIVLLAWVMIFDYEPSSRAHFHLIEDLLGEVGADGRMLMPLANIPAHRAGNMSERTDLFGENATIWVTATDDRVDARGAILTALNGVVIHLLAVAPYESAGQDRAVSLIERIAMNMATRQQALRMTPANDTMSRLPLLGDVDDSIENATVGVNKYDANSG